MNKISEAYKILQENDRGHYTIPTKGLYPFQWNWDSCLTALGFSYFDEARAWREIQTLFVHQWEDGMVPHIVFHEHDDGYFPGPEVWDTGREIPTSGITQPPVAGLVVRRIFERAENQELAKHEALKLLPKILAWHEWFYANRDPQRTGLVALLHPWESGRDNSVDWDEPFDAVPTEGVEPYERRDTQHADPEHRPTKGQYDRYIYLVQLFRSLNWDNSKLHDASPFRVIDPGFNAILIRSSKDMAQLAQALGEETMSNKFELLAQKGEEAMEQLWSEKWEQYLCYDRAADAFIDSPSVGGIIPIIGVDSHAPQIARRLEHIAQHCKYLVPSHDPSTLEFNSLRYWRGPSWLIVNYLVAKGLRDSGQSEIAAKIIEHSIELIEKSGFAEYYDPITAEPCGGGRFTWTAAMVIEFLKTDAL